MATRRKRARRFLARDISCDFTTRDSLAECAYLYLRLNETKAISCSPSDMFARSRVMFVSDEHPIAGAPTSDVSPPARDCSVTRQEMGALRCSIELLARKARRAGVFALMRVIRKTFATPKVMPSNKGWLWLGSSLIRTK